MNEGLLLDTCAAIWFAEDAPIAAAASTAMDEAAANSMSVMLSPISAWEHAMLVSKGRLRSTLPPNKWFEALLAVEGIKLAPMLPDVLIDASFLPEPLHRDPADRIIIATARSMGLTIVTRDRHILDYAAQGHVRALAC